MNVSEQIRALRALQHLLLIDDEAAHVGTPGGESVARQIEKAVAALPKEAAEHYRRLVARDHLFLSALARGNCSACGARVSATALQHAIAADRLTPCAVCGRLLYAPEVKATGLCRIQPDAKFPLSRFSTVKLMVPRLKATSAEEAMRELAAALAREKVIADPQAVLDAALQRERILTTAVGHGLAFPHMRGVEEGVLTFAAGLAPNGLDWNGTTVNLVLFTVMPVVAAPFYLKLLGAFARAFTDDEQMPFLLAAPDGKTLWKELNRITRAEVKDLAP